MIAAIRMLWPYQRKTRTAEVKQKENRHFVPFQEIQHKHVF